MDHDIAPAVNPERGQRNSRSQGRSSENSFLRVDPEGGKFNIDNTDAAKADLRLELCRIFSQFGDVTRVTIDEISLKFAAGYFQDMENAEREATNPISGIIGKQTRVNGQRIIRAIVINRNNKQNYHTYVQRKKKKTVLVDQSKFVKPNPDPSNQPVFPGWENDELPSYRTETGEACLSGINFTMPVGTVARSKNDGEPRYPMEQGVCPIDAAAGTFENAKRSHEAGNNGMRQLGASPFSNKGSHPDFDADPNLGPLNEAVLVNGDNRPITHYYNELGGELELQPCSGRKPGTRDYRDAGGDWNLLNDAQVHQRRELVDIVEDYGIENPIVLTSSAIKSANEFLEWIRTYLYETPGLNLSLADCEMMLNRCTSMPPDELDALKPLRLTLVVAFQLESYADMRITRNSVIMASSRIEEDNEAGGDDLFDFEPRHPNDIKNAKHFIEYLKSVLSHFGPTNLMHSRIQGMLLAIPEHVRKAMEEFGGLAGALTSRKSKDFAVANDVIYLIPEHRDYMPQSPTFPTGPTLPTGSTLPTGRLEMPTAEHPPVYDVSAASTSADEATRAAGNQSRISQILTNSKLRIPEALQPTIQPTTSFQQAPTLSSNLQQANTFQPSADVDSNPVLSPVPNSSVPSDFAQQIQPDRIRFTIANTSARSTGVAHPIFISSNADGDISTGGDPDFHPTHFPPPSFRLHGSDYAPNLSNTGSDNINNNYPPISRMQNTSGEFTGGFEEYHQYYPSRAAQDSSSYGYRAPYEGSSRQPNVDPPVDSRVHRPESRGISRQPGYHSGGRIDDFVGSNPVNPSMESGAYHSARSQNDETEARPNLSQFVTSASGGRYHISEPVVTCRPANPRSSNRTAASTSSQEQEESRLNSDLAGLSVRDERRSTEPFRRDEAGMRDADSPPSASTAMGSEPAAASSARKARRASLEDCVICYERPKDHIIIRCGHICVCNICAESLLRLPLDQKKCPICREQIKDIIKTYT